MISEVELLRMALVGLKRKEAEIERELAQLEGRPRRGGYRGYMSAKGRRNISRANRKRWEEYRRAKAAA